MKKNLFRTGLALLAALILTLGCALGETADTAEATGPALLATVNGEEIYDDNADLQEVVSYFSDYYAQYGYDTSDPGIQAMFRASGLNWAVESALYRQKAAELGITVTDERRAEIEAEGKAQWEQVVSYFTSQVAQLGADATDEEKAAARADALSAIEAQYGYTEESYIAEYVNSSVQSEIRASVIQAEMGDLSATEDEIIAAFNEKVAQDQDLYEGNAFMYEYYTQYMGETSYYIPSGYRGVIHILLDVDEELLNNYTDLSARLEEQQGAADNEDTDEDGETVEEEAAEEEAPEEETPAEEAAEEEAPAEDATGTIADSGEGNGTAQSATDEMVSTEPAEPEATEEPVTQEMVDAARQAILDSVQPTVDEIMTKFQAGTAFVDLVAEYGTDPGMQTPDNLNKGYMVHADSILWDPAFTAAAMSMEKVGDVSEPTVGSNGVHILYYLRDVPAGAVDMTEEIRNTLKAQVDGNKEAEATNQMTAAWKEAADIQYTEAGQAILDAADAAAAAASAEDTAEDEGEPETLEEPAEDEAEGEAEAPAVEDEGAEAPAAEEATEAPAGN